MTRVLVVTFNEVSSEIIALLGNGLNSNIARSFLNHTTDNVPYPLAEHVKTPLNGAAANVSMG